MEYIHDSDLPPASQHPDSYICPHVNISSSVACYSHGSAGLCCIFDGLCVSQKFLSPPINCLIRYLIRLINFPIFSKILHYRKTEFSANIHIHFKPLISSIFSTRWPNIFTTGVTICYTEIR